MAEVQWSWHTRKFTWQHGTRIVRFSMNCGSVWSSHQRLLSKVAIWFAADSNLKIPNKTKQRPLSFQTDWDLNRVLEIRAFVTYQNGDFNQKKYQKLFEFWLKFLSIKLKVCYRFWKQFVWPSRSKRMEEACYPASNAMARHGSPLTLVSTMGLKTL